MCAKLPILMESGKSNYLEWEPKAMKDNKYTTVSLTEKQNDAVEMVKELLEQANEGPYGGRGKSVSKGAAIEYACRTILPELAKQVEQIQKKKRMEAATKRQNNNPNITPGVSRTAEPPKRPEQRYSDWRQLPNAQRLADREARKTAEAASKSRGLLGRLRII